MSELLEKQIRFSKILGILLLYAPHIGYDLTLGEGYDDDNTGHQKGSNHYVRLAQDINVFKNGLYLQGEDATAAHNKLHDAWDQLGGAPRIDHDLNHYSIEFKGVR